MSQDEHDDSAEKKRERARARSSWPGRKMRLEDLPDVELVGGTPEERLAMVWRITLDVWASSGTPLPEYRREDAPGCITRGIRR